MRIGIDAKWYYSGPPSGINVVRNLVDNVIKYNSKDNIVFYLNKKDMRFKGNFASKISGKNNLSFIFIPGRINIITNMLLFPYYIWNNKIDIVLFQNYIPIWGSSKTKYINYVHDILFLDYPEYFTKLENIIYRFMIYSIKKAKYVITISKSEKNRIIKHSGIHFNNISYVYHGLDPIFYERPKNKLTSIKNKYKLPSNYILYVGRINVRKNIQTLLKSISVLDKKISLVIIGKESNSLNLNNEVTNLGITDKVYRLGYVSDNDLAKIVSGATIFVFPSYAEGFGLPPLEAMKSGIPTIVTKLTSLPEICGDAVLYFDVDNHLDLASKIEILLEDQNLYSNLKSKGILKANEYSWEKSVKKIMGIFNKVNHN